MMWKKTRWLSKPWQEVLPFIIPTMLKALKKRNHTNRLSPSSVHRFQSFLHNQDPSGFFECVTFLFEVL